MNEADTRAELIDPKIKESGWNVVPESKIHREYYITTGRIQGGGRREKPLKADYVLSYKGRKLAAVEAKSNEQDVSEGVAQAKNYADKLHLDTAIAANGIEIYHINMLDGKEGAVPAFPTPDELWQRSFPVKNEGREKLDAIPFENAGGYNPYYYQETAINNVISAIADGKERILLTLATGTGKTFIAFQIVWKLFYSRWNLKRDGSRRPRILFLADRNILADQAFNAFSAFPDDALVRIKPDEIRKKGLVPTNGNIFFTIFQTFMSGPDNTPYFGSYPKDYFDFIIVDECHRGGANDEGNWRGILEYFSPAVQLGLTATPRREENRDTYEYFDEPVYIYSLKEGINDGFLTPFRVKRIKTSLDEYVYVPDDKVIEGDVEAGRVYAEPDFNWTIEIKEREAERVKILLSEINQNEKTLIFCANQGHAALVRDLINQYKKNPDPNYCQRVTANDGELGEQHLRDFQDNDKTIPTILTTSQKLSTGIDARNIRNIVLMRSIKSMVEFKQIIGRGTRLFEGKYYFTIYDFVGACHHFSDKDWDGEPEPETCETCGQKPCVCVKEPPNPCPVCGQRPCICPKPVCPKCGQSPCVCLKKIKIKLAPGKELVIQHMITTSFYGADGKPMSVEEFVAGLYGELPKFFKDEAELRNIWANPITRHAFLEKLAAAGYNHDDLSMLQKLIAAEKSDLFDVLEYVSFAIKPITRAERAEQAKAKMFIGLTSRQHEFLDFVLTKYIETGVEELDQEKIPALLKLKYHEIDDATVLLGDVQDIRRTFIDFQKYLYQ